MPIDEIQLRSEFDSVATFDTSQLASRVIARGRRVHRRRRWVAGVAVVAAVSLIGVAGVNVLNRPQTGVPAAPLSAGPTPALGTSSSSPARVPAGKIIVGNRGDVGFALPIEGTEGTQDTSAWTVADAPYTACDAYPGPWRGTEPTSTRVVAQSAPRGEKRFLGTLIFPDTTSAATFVAEAIGRVAKQCDGQQSDSGLGSLAVEIGSSNTAATDWSVPVDTIALTVPARDGSESAAKGTRQAIMRGEFARDNNVVMFGLWLGPELGPGPLADSFKVIDAYLDQMRMSACNAGQCPSTGSTSAPSIDPATEPTPVSCTAPSLDSGSADSVVVADRLVVTKEVCEVARKLVAYQFWAAHQINPARFEDYVCTTSDAGAAGRTVSVITCRKEDKVVSWRLTES